MVVVSVGLIRTRSILSVTQIHVVTFKNTGWITQSKWIYYNKVIIEAYTCNKFWKIKNTNWANSSQVYCMEIEKRIKWCLYNITRR